MLIYIYLCLQIDYYLEENHNWDLSMAELHRAIEEHKSVCYPSAIVVINPGNPTGISPFQLLNYSTSVAIRYIHLSFMVNIEQIQLCNIHLFLGQVLSRAVIQKIIKFAHKEGLVILADEVYQHNIYCNDCTFFSFKEVLSEMGPDYLSVKLASFMTISKGFSSE